MMIHATAGAVILVIGYANKQRENTSIAVMMSYPPLGEDSEECFFVRYPLGPGPIQVNCVQF